MKLNPRPSSGTWTATTNASLQSLTMLLHSPKIQTEIYILKGVRSHGQRVRSLLETEWFAKLCTVPGGPKNCCSHEVALIAVLSIFFFALLKENLQHELGSKTQSLISTTWKCTNATIRLDQSSVWSHSLSSSILELQEWTVSWKDCSSRDLC